MSQAPPKKKRDVTFYFAASYPRKAEMANKAELLNQETGCFCNSQWVFANDHTVDITDAADLAPDGKGLRFAFDNLNDIAGADAVLFFAASEKEGAIAYPPGRGGRHTELGLSLALMKPIYVVGDRENLFHALIPQHRIFYSFRDFLLGMDMVREDVVDHLDLWPRNDAQYIRRVELMLDSLSTKY